MYKQSKLPKIYKLPNTVRILNRLRVYSLTRFEGATLQMSQIATDLVTPNICQHHLVLPFKH